MSKNIRNESTDAVSYTHLDVYKRQVKGKIFNVEEREIRGERTIITMTLSDFTDTIHVKMFVKNEFLEDIRGKIKAGAFVKLKGMTTLDRFDHELTISSVVGIKKIADFTTHRMDYSYKKRVELHCHTKMSDMDGVTDAAVLLNRAKSVSYTHLDVYKRQPVEKYGYFA